MYIESIWKYLPIGEKLFLLFVISKLRKNMQFCTVRNVKKPKRANSTDAGIDFFVPDEMTPEDFRGKPEEGAELFFMNGYLDSIRLDPGGRVLIPSGVHVRLNPGTALVLMNKSGVAAKRGLVIGSCVVDESYMGEIHISLINTTSNSVRIEPGEKITQGLILNVEQSKPEEAADLDELYKDFESSRGAGGFGSSGTK
jgi:dUTP pyrophosphatase